MKKLLIGLLALGSISAFSGTCTLKSYWKYPSVSVVNPGKKIETLDVYSIEECVLEAKERLKLTTKLTACDMANAPSTRSADYCDNNRVSYKGIIKKVKYKFKSHDEKYQGIIKH